MTPGIASLNPGLMSSQPFRAVVCTPEAFYERDVKRETCPPTARPGNNTPPGSQPRFRRDETCDRRGGIA